MIASPSCRFVFLHVPKCAGTSIRLRIKEAFGDTRDLIEGWGIEDGLDLAHLTPAELAAQFPAVHALLSDPGTTSVAVVRDPLPRCVSAFAEHRRQYGGHASACATLAGYLERIEAGAFADSSPDSHLFIHGAPQVRFLLDRGRCVPGHLLRADDPLLHAKVSLLFRRPLAAFEPATQWLPPSHVTREEVKMILRIYAADYDLVESVDVTTFNLDRPGTIQPRSVPSPQTSSTQHPETEK